MNKIERLDRVLDGQAVDRPPLSLWYHFGVQFGSGEQFAKLSLAFFDHYGFDFLKVMNDYFYPPPQGLESIESADDLKLFDRFDVTGCDWVEQFRALEYIAAALDGKAYFIDTVFDPWQTIQRHLAGRNMRMLMTEAPEALVTALDIVADNLIAYCRTSLRIGSAGIFLSIPAAAEFVSREEFLKFVKPPAMKIFNAIADRGRMNTVHVHGTQLFFDDCLDFPVPIFSWWDRGPHGPGLAEGKQKIDGCVMGGIDQTIVSRSSPGFIRDHVREGIRLGGDRRFILAGGCSIPTWIYPGSIKAIVETTAASVSAEASPDKSART